MPFIAKFGPDKGSRFSYSWPRAFCDYNTANGRLLSNNTSNVGFSRIE
jgi:hypothetical protein